MLFSSSVFLFLFLPIVLILYFNPIVKNRIYRNIILLVASLFFYAWGEPVFVLLMVASIVVNWLIGLAMAGSGRKKTWLVLSVVWNLSLMFVFKYLTFVLSNVELLLHRNIADIEISLPLGISFFTFQILSYIFDLYYGNTKVQKNCYKFALYVSMFPQLVAGPIVRYEQIAYEIDHRQENMEDFSLGMTRFVYGLGKKVLLSNYMGTIADNMFYLSGNSNLSAASAWLGGIAYTLQIYYDFSGYSDMAIGLGRMFGFAYGEKENGAVFSHMTVMYANALYQRGFIREGYKALQTLADTALDFDTSRIYPGIPEYFNAEGRGMYAYLTGAASWYMLTLITEVFGVKGSFGDLVLEPKLVKEQFDDDGNAGVHLEFAGNTFVIRYHNAEKKDYGAYQISEVAAMPELDIRMEGKKAVISKTSIEKSNGGCYTVNVILK